MCGTCTADLKRIRGCETPVRQPRQYPGDPPYALCPARFARDNPRLFHRLVLLHNHWLKGILPSSGGLSDQAAALPRAVATFDHGVETGKAALQEEAAQEREARAKRARGSGRGR